jgi:hypothetical protein
MWSKCNNDSTFTAQRGAVLQAEECIAWSCETGTLREFGCLFLNSLNEIFFRKTLIHGCSHFVGYWLHLSYFQVNAFKKLFL